MKRIGFSASEEMSFENVDGRTTDTFIYYMLTYEPKGSGELKNVYPCTPHFHYIKVGYKRVYITRTCFRDDKNIFMLN